MSGAQAECDLAWKNEKLKDTWQLQNLHDVEAIRVTRQTCLLCHTADMSAVVYRKNIVGRALVPPPWATMGLWGDRRMEEIRSW